MIQRIVAGALRMPIVVFAAAVLLIVLGLAAYKELDIEAYPNPVPPLVEVITQPPGWSAEETERYVTIPLEIGLSGMPGLDHIRSQSLFGLSDVKCYFGWGTEYKEARQETINRIQFVQLPTGLQAQLSPWNAIGELISLQGRRQRLHPERSENRRGLDPRASVQAGAGSHRRPRATAARPSSITHRGRPLQAARYGVTLNQVETAITNGNQNVGGQRLFMGEQSYDVRGIGLLGSRTAPVHDIENIVVAAQKGTPVRVKDVADVAIGFAPRLGIVGYNAEPDVVQGIVLMRYGGRDAEHAGGDLQAKFGASGQPHPHPAASGMDIEPYYDSRRPGSPGHAHGHGEPARRDGPRQPGSVAVPRARAGRDHHGHQHPPGAPHRVLRPRDDTHLGEPHLARGGRLRHRCRLDRHHDGEHLPAPRAARRNRLLERIEQELMRSGDPDDVLHNHHRRCVPSSLHDDGRLGRHLLSNGAYLRLCDRWGHPPRDHPDAGARVEVRFAQSSGRRRASMGDARSLWRHL